MNKSIPSSSFISTCVRLLLRTSRCFTFFLLGQSQLSSGDSGARARAGIFGSLFSLFSLFHFFNYTLKYNTDAMPIDLIFILISAFLLFFRPESARLLWLLMVASTISAIAQAPVDSNHTIVRNFVVLGYWLSFFYSMFKNQKGSEIFINFTTSGQGVLLVMYFFGIFHKINTGFLNPETSCAVTLWSRMPFPLNLISNPMMDYLAIYGTFLIEGLLVLMLLTRRLRHIAITLGILFHLLLALSGYAMYISFTVLTISLHCLFLNEQSALNIRNSAFMHVVRTRKTSPAYIVLGTLLLFSIIIAAILREYSLVTILVLPIVLPFCYAIIRHGASQQTLLHSKYKLSSSIIGYALSALFFLNCAMPYLGLKTAQAINMFSNLRLEDGVSNHLIMPPPGPFKYLEDLAYIDGHNGEIALDKYMVDGYGIVYYNLLAFVADYPNAVISYTRNNISYVDMNKETLTTEIEEHLHHSWFRKWFHFEIADLNDSKYCEQRRAPKNPNATRIPDTSN